MKIKPSFAFPPHPCAYFLISGYLLRTPDNSNVFSSSLEVSSYRESTVHISGFSCGSLKVPFYLCEKKKLSRVERSLAPTRATLSLRSKRFFVPYFSARLDFPLPPLSAPGSPRMEQSTRNESRGTARKWLSFHFSRCQIRKSRRGIACHTGKQRRNPCSGPPTDSMN